MSLFCVLKCCFANSSNMEEQSLFSMSGGTHRNQMHLFSVAFTK